MAATVVNRRSSVEAQGTRETVTLGSGTTAAARRRFGVAISGLCLLVVCVISAEAAARVQDWVRDRVPVFASPTRDAELVLQDELGIRGRPHGRFKKWSLNAFGFRGPEIQFKPNPRCQRVLTLGASETFGLYESPNHEYPAELSRRLQGPDCFEVVNAGLYGLTLPALLQNWTGWSSRFRPAIVTIYPTPSFYLATESPRPVTYQRLPVSSTRTWNLRLLDRARDLIDVPAYLQRRRIANALRAAERQHDRSWFFSEVPSDRLYQYRQDLRALVDAVSRSGARVVLITHATGFSGTPATQESKDALAAWRQLLVRPTGEVLLSFELAANAATREVATEFGTGLIDLEATLAGKPQYFAPDYLHFNDSGSGAVATLLSQALTPARR